MARELPKVIAFFIAAALSFRVKSFCDLNQELTYYERRLITSGIESNFICIL